MLKDLKMELLNSEQTTEAKGGTTKQVSLNTIVACADVEVKMCFGIEFKNCYVVETKFCDVPEVKHCIKIEL